MFIIIINLLILYSLNYFFIFNLYNQIYYKYILALSLQNLDKRLMSKPSLNNIFFACDSI